MIDKKRMGNYLKQLREQKSKEDEKNYTLFDLSLLFIDYGKDISANAIAEWENGNTIPTQDNLEILSNIYGKTMDEILDGADMDEINYKEKYYFYNDEWMHKNKSENLYQMRNEQIKLITTRFKELLLIRIDRHFSRNEESEFRFIFSHFYHLSDSAKEYSKLDIKNEYLLIKDCINEMLVEIRNMSKDEKYWELQKLFCEDEKLWFSFWRDVCDIEGVNILKERFDLIEDWQKDMLLAMFQNIIPFDRDPARYGGLSLERYEKEHGEFNREKLVKDEIKTLIKRGACLNKTFFSIKKGYDEKKRIIDRLEYLYNLCLRPIEISIRPDEIKTYRIENNKRNRFLDRYYFTLRYALKGHQTIDLVEDDVDEIYNWFINSNEITDDVYLSIAKRERINTDRDKKYWLADAKIASHIESSFNEFKAKEKEIEEDLKEIKELEEKLKNGEKEYSIHKYEVVGGDNEKDIREYIEYWKSNLDYSEYLKNRDKTSTNKLLKEIDSLSLNEIRKKYFPVEVFENE